MITTEAVTFSVQLIAKAAVLAARWAGYVRHQMLHSYADGTKKELLFLQARVEELESEVQVLRVLLKRRDRRSRHTLRQRLHVIFHLELFRIPRRQVSRFFDVLTLTPLPGEWKR